MPDLESSSRKKAFTFQTQLMGFESWFPGAQELQSPLTLCQFQGFALLWNCLNITLVCIDGKLTVRLRLRVIGLEYWYRSTTNSNRPETKDYIWQYFLCIGYSDGGRLRLLTAIPRSSNRIHHEMYTSAGILPFERSPSLLTGNLVEFFYGLYRWL